MFLPDSKFATNYIPLTNCLEQQMHLAYLPYLQMSLKKNFRLTNIAMDNPPFFLVNTIKMVDVPARLCCVVYPQSRVPKAASPNRGSCLPRPVWWHYTYMAYNRKHQLRAWRFWMQVGTGSVQGGVSFGKRSWCLNQPNPSEKNARQMGSFPQSRDENHKYLMKPSGKLTFAIEKIHHFQ